MAEIGRPRVKEGEMVKALGFSTFIYVEFFDEEGWAVGEECRKDGTLLGRQKRIEHWQKVQW